MESITVHDLTAAYALDALDAGEAREYEEHLAHCERCQRELAQLSGAAASLAFAVDAPAPPGALRDRILVQARAERGTNVVPLRPRWTFAAKAVTAAAAVLALGFGIWAASLSRSLESERSAREQADRAVTVLADPDARRIALQGARGSLVVGDTGAALIVHRLERAPKGKTYEAWVIQDGKPVRAGEFLGGEETTVLRLARPVPDGAQVAVTVEREGGVDAPQGPVVMRAAPV